MKAAEKPAEAPQESRKALAAPAAADGLSARHEAAQERVEALRLERDAATLAGKGFDHGRLRDAEDEVEAIEAAQAEIVRRERVVLADAERERLRAARRQAIARNADRVAAIEEAEALARALTDALLRAETSRADLAKAVREAGERLPGDLQKTEQIDRLGRGLSAILARVGEAGKLGEISLHVTSHRAEDAWLRGEEQAERQLAAMMEDEA